VKYPFMGLCGTIKGYCHFILIKAHQNEMAVFIFSGPKFYNGKTGSDLGESC